MGQSTSMERKMKGWRSLIVEAEVFAISLKRNRKGERIVLNFSSQMKKERAAQSEIYRRYKQFCRARADSPR